MALANQMAQAQIQEFMKSLAPVFEKIALTPEKLMELKKPYIDPAAIERQKRELRRGRAEEKALRENDERRRANCSHKYKDGSDSISLVHNQLDHRVVGVCMLCHDWIHGKRWIIEAPDAVTGEGVAKIQEAHKDYSRVLSLESQS